jgi:hypothetical protein
VLAERVPPGARRDRLIAVLDVETLLAFEHAVWRALVDGDPAADERWLSDDFLGVYPTGYAGRADHVRQLVDGPTVADYELHDARVVAVADDAAVLVYRAAYRRPDRDDREEMYVSSLWCRRGDTWVNTFSQDTPVGGAVV